MKLMLAMVIVGAVVVGCSNNKNMDERKTALAPAVTDISPTPMVAAAPAQPVVYDAQPAAAPGAAAGGKYVVKKGDTLWSIATAHYGSGNQWQRICSANPGVTEKSLKAGQAITLP